MSLYKEACLEEDAHFIVLCELTSIAPTSHNIEALYDYIVVLRTLNKPFYMTLDTTKAGLSNYLLHLPKLIRELTKVGRCRCLKLEIILYDRLGFIAILQNIISGLTIEDTQGCEIKLRPKEPEIF